MRAPDASLGVTTYTTQPNRTSRPLLLIPVLAIAMAGSCQPAAGPAVHHTATAARPASRAVLAPHAGPAGTGARVDPRPPPPLIAPAAQVHVVQVPVVESAVQQVRHRPEATRVAVRIPGPRRRGTARPSRSTRPVLSVVAVGLVTGDVGRVIAYAYAQLGKPYIWASAGPRGFDCSGLTMAAYATIGIRLPHLAASQAGYGRRVALDALQPGDLLIFYGGGHVGLYIGGGQMIAASRPGRPIAVQRVSDTPDEARRLVG